MEASTPSGAAWTTAKVGESYDYVSPGGTAEIRLLPSFEEGELVHARVLPAGPSVPATMTGSGEFFYVLKGEGELWRKSGDVEDVTRLVPQRCVSLPPGIEFQYTALRDSMELLVMTAPRWKRENWREGESRYWTESGEVVSTATRRPGPWVTVDLAPNYDYLAPNGSEIRLLTTYDAGGLAHCRLPSALASAPVRHRTVVEIWYSLAGRGEVWRSNAEGEEIVEVEAGTALTIPVGTSFQFRSSADEALEIMIGTFPRWPGGAEAEPVAGCWEPTAERLGEA